MSRRLVPIVLALVAAAPALALSACGEAVPAEEATADTANIEFSDVPAGPAGTSASTALVVEGGTEGGGADDPAGGGTATPIDYSIVAQATVPEIVARAEPTDDGAVVATLANPTDLGAPLVFRAVDPPRTSGDWIEVQLPIRPNGSTGWIRQSEVALSNNPYRVEVERATHSIRVYEGNRLWIETLIGVGTGATPTPVGDFYLTELIRTIEPEGAYGPFAFGLSGFSETLETFGDADVAVIGLHGTNDPSSLGTDVSSGCIRLPNDVIEQLAATLPLGTPVVIT